MCNTISSQRLVTRGSTLCGSTARKGWIAGSSTAMTAVGGAKTAGRSSFEARKCAHLIRMTR
jgi:hypothetical protein